MSAVTVCAAGVVASILALILKKQNAEYSFILVVCTSSILIIYILGALLEAVGGVKEIFEASKISETYLSILLKCVVICFLTEFTCDTCKDAGQAALANIVLFAGRLLVLTSALPLFSELLGLVTELAGG